MNSGDPFEKRLEQLPQRQIPTAWRREILSLANEVSSRQQVVDTGIHWVSRFNSMITAVLWPHPRAWAGLAAVWVLVFGMSFATREPAQVAITQQYMPTSRQMREMLRQQERLLAELVGPNGTPENDLSKPAAPRSQGGRREEFVNT